jgi:hypothetical protein
MTAAQLCYIFLELAAVAAALVTELQADMAAMAVHMVVEEEGYLFHVF